MDDLREIEDRIDAAAELDGAAVTELLAKVHPRLQRALERVARPAARIGVIESSVGRLFVAESDRGLLGVHYSDTGDDIAMIDAIRQKFDLREDAEAARRILTKSNVHWPVTTMPSRVAASITASSPVHFSAAPSPVSARSRPAVS